MNRRRAINTILLLTGTIGVAFTSYKGYQWFKKPDFDFLTREKNTLEVLTEIIIPKTDTPGAKEAGVADTLILLLKDCSSRATQNKFIDGLKSLMIYAKDHYKKSFLDCSHTEQVAILKYFQQNGKPFNGLPGKIQKKYLGKSFYSTLVEYTTIGYCTSELGATKGLAYVLIPGRYDSCTSLETGQKSWALN